MELKIPIDIGDPVLVVKTDQHDDAYIECKQFTYSDMPDYLKGRIFLKFDAAQSYIKDWNVL